MQINRVNAFNQESGFKLQSQFETTNLYFEEKYDGSITSFNSLGAVKTPPEDRGRAVLRRQNPQSIAGHETQHCSFLCWNAAAEGQLEEGSSVHCQMFRGRGQGFSDDQVLAIKEAEIEYTLFSILVTYLKLRSTLLTTTNGLPAAA